MSSERVLVIGAHCDDESFGCLGTLLKHKEAGDKISFLWYTEARNTGAGAWLAAIYFDVVKAKVVDLKDQQLDTYSLVEVIEQVEYMLEDVKPTIVYCPFIGDLNRDHRIVAEATMVACRPYKFAHPPQVEMYAIPGSTELGLWPFFPDRVEKINVKLKEKLIREWYPNELINGREVIKDIEEFERWPR